MDANEPHPQDLAFIALSLHRVGRVEEAKAALVRLRELCKDKQYAESTEALGFLAEAEGLIEGKKP